MENPMLNILAYKFMPSGFLFKFLQRFCVKKKKRFCVTGSNVIAIIIYSEKP